MFLFRSFFPTCGAVPFPYSIHQVDWSPSPPHTGAWAVFWFGVTSFSRHFSKHPLHGSTCLMDFILIRKERSTMYYVNLHTINTHSLSTCQSRAVPYPTCMHTILLRMQRTSMSTMTAWTKNTSVDEEINEDNRSLSINLPRSRTCTPNHILHTQVHHKRIQLESVKIWSPKTPKRVSMAAQLMCTLDFFQFVV